MVKWVWHNLLRYDMLILSSGSLDFRDFQKVTIEKIKARPRALTLGISCGCHHFGLCRKDKSPI
jgi:hypothetical protein